MITRITKKFPLGRFSEIPADLIDQVYLQESKGILNHSKRFIKLESLYMMFLIAVLCDLMITGGLSVRYFMGALLRADDVQDSRLAQQKKYNSLFSKNVLALLSAMPGFMSPRLVTNHFIPERKMIGVMSGGNHSYAPDAIVVTPQSVEEIQKYILTARENNIKIMPMGAGRSQGRQYLPEGKSGIILDLKNLNTIEIDAKSKTAVVGAGARWIDLQIKANEYKLALQVMQASNIFSVGGSIGTNIHGWNHRIGMLSNAIASMTVINGLGQLQTLTPKKRLFHYITGGLGLMGTVVSVKIKLMDNLLLKEASQIIDNINYVNYFYQEVLSNPHIHMHLFRLSLDPKRLLLEGVAVNYVLDNETPQTTESLVPELPYGKREESILINATRKLDVLRKLYWIFERGRLLKNNSAPLTTNAIMQPPINAMFTPSRHQTEWLQEYFLPGECLNNFLIQLSALLIKNKVKLLNASVRFVKQNSKSPLSYAYDGDRFAVVLCFTQFLQEHHLIQARKWLRAAQRLAVEMGGTYYLPYQDVSSIEDFFRGYPRERVLQFIQMKKEKDPSNIFVSGLYQKYFLAAEHRTHLHTIMQNQITQQQFAGFLRNVLMRVDVDALYVLLNDILTYKDTHQEIYEELIKRLPNIMPTSLSSAYGIFYSLYAIKRDLALQAKKLLPEVKQINGLVEIGYPGRFVAGFQSQFDVQGIITVALEQTSLTDYIQTNFRKPYQAFHKLDYSHPNLTTLKDNSADVITCYVGLHHFPPATLESFLKDIQRVLRPNGHFLLVDHDVTESYSMAYAHGAHTIFNAVNGVSVKDEINETRNFHPMKHWIAQLEEAGLSATSVGRESELIRRGDPSRNRMICFKNNKPALRQEQKLSYLNDVSVFAPLKKSNQSAAEDARLLLRKASHS